jgi:cytochrome c553
MPRASHLPTVRSALIALSLTSSAIAADNLNWAYPVAPKSEPHYDRAAKQVPGSTRKYTQAQIDDPFNTPDWFPDAHPAMPEVVARGRKPAVQACAQCHLPTGDGHPESASLAGLPASYLIRQMAAFKNGERKGVRADLMIPIAKAISDAEVRAASDYYAGLIPGVLTKVIEAPRVMATYVGPGGMRFALADGGMEPIGSRIIVLPQSVERVSLRDPRTGFAYFVPPGSVARGATLLTAACGSCHGADQVGAGEVPGIAGRPPTYLFRQLNDYKSGARSGPAAQSMRSAVEKLTVDDMIAIAAYLGSREPMPKPAEPPKNDPPK